jgi:hypothetical protein
MARTTNRMQEAVEKLAANFKLVAYNTVTYTPASTGVAITGISATVGRTPYEISDGISTIAYESRDFFIAQADLVDGSGNELTPTNGDRITDVAHVYEVSIPKPLNLFERIGPSGSMLKIHTKAVT